MSKNPHASRMRTWRSAASTMLSGVTPMEATRSLGRLPVLTPMRMGTLCAFAQSTTRRTSSWRSMLPGLMRSLWMPFSIAPMASRWSKWMSAISGTGE